MRNAAIVTGALLAGALVALLLRSGARADAPQVRPREMEPAADASPSLESWGVVVTEERAPLVDAVPEESWRPVTDGDRADARASLAIPEAPPTAVPGWWGEAELTGVVVERRTRRPVAGAEVILNDPLDRDGSVTSGRTLTDDAGCFEFRGLQFRDVACLQILAEGYAFRAVYIPNLKPLPRDSEGRVVIALDEGARVTGLVIDEHGRPITEGRALLAPHRAGFRGMFSSDTQETLSAFAFSGGYQRFAAAWRSAELDAEGRFVIEDAPVVPEADNAHVLVLSPHAHFLIERLGALVPGDEREVTLRCTRAASVSGSFVAPADDSPADFGIWLCKHARACPVYLHDSWFPLEDDGRFVIGPLVPGARVRVGWKSFPRGHLKRYSLRFYGDWIPLDGVDLDRPLALGPAPPG